MENFKEPLTEKSIHEIADEFLGDDEFENKELNKRFVWETLIERGFSEKKVEAIWNILRRLCKNHGIEVILDAGWR